jgi:hypothetical protein
MKPRTLIQWHIDEFINITMIELYNKSSKHGLQAVMIQTTKYWWIHQISTGRSVGWCNETKDTYPVTSWWIHQHHNDWALWSILNTCSSSSHDSGHKILMNSSNKYRKTITITSRNQGSLTNNILMNSSESQWSSTIINTYNMWFKSSYLRLLNIDEFISIWSGRHDMTLLTLASLHKFVNPHNQRNEG